MTKTTKTTNDKFDTREAWLKAAVEALRPIFEEHGYEIPVYRVSCGWPSRGATKLNAQTIGQAWDPKCSGDDTPEMFISPVLGAYEVDIVLATLVHEVVHIVVGSECGHRGAFKKCATEVGLEGKMTETHAGEELERLLQVIATDLGTYPHAKITPGATKKKNKNRHHKLVCQKDECGFSCRAANGPVEEFGVPWHCEKEMVFDIPEEEEEEEEDEPWTPPTAPKPPIKDLTKKEAKARKAANDKASRKLRNAKKEETRLAKLSDEPLMAKIGVTFYDRNPNGSRGTERVTDEHTLIRYVDGDRFDYSEDGGTMWMDGTCDEKLA